MRLARRSTRSAAAATFAAAVLLATTASALAVPDALPELEWERLPDGPDVALQAMVYDTANDMLWSFGGVSADAGSNQFTNAVWRLDLAEPEARWQRLALGGLRPPPLAFHTAVYDPLRGRMIVYGGLVDRDGTSDQTPADGNTVWFLDLADPSSPTWSRESVPGVTADRFAHAAAYVTEFDAMVVSGGLSTFSSARNDHYALLLGEEPLRWQRLSNAGFTPRAGHALVYEAEGDRLLAYGGLSSLSDVATYADVLELDLAEGLDGADSWHRLSTSTPGVNRALMATAYDPDLRLWWVSGGIAANGRFLRDLSVLDLSTDAPEWTRTQVVYNGPLERFGHAGVWDGMRQRMIVQGGTPDNAATLKDTRALAYVDDVATATATDAPSATVTASATVGTSVIPTASATSTAATPTSSATPGTTPTGQTPAATDEATATATQPGIATATPAGTETRLLYLPTLLTH